MKPFKQDGDKLTLISTSDELGNIFFWNIWLAIKKKNLLIIYKLIKVNTIIIKLRLILINF